MPRLSSRFLAAALIAALLLTGITAAGEVRETLSRTVEIDPAKAAAEAAERAGEVVKMRWRLGGFLGFLAGIFVPRSGDVLLTITPSGEDRQEIQVLITTPGHEGEYFLYGAEVDEVSASTTAVWSSYVFRDRKKEREQQVEEPNVIDFASAIYHLRLKPPRETTRLKIWDNGKTYPVEIRPLKPERRKISGRKVNVRGYAVRGVEVDGKPAFEEKFTLYFARDARSTPVEIMGKRGLIRLRIEAVDPGGGARSSGSAAH